MLTITSRVFQNRTSLLSSRDTHVTLRSVRFVARVVSGGGLGVVLMAALFCGRKLIHHLLCLHGKWPDRCPAIQPARTSRRIRLHVRCQ